MSAVHYTSFIVARRDPEATKAQYLNANKGWTTDISDATTYKSELEATYAANVTKSALIVSLANTVVGLRTVEPQELHDLDVPDVGEFLNGPPPASEEVTEDTPA